MTKPAFSPTKVMKLRPLKDTVLVTDMQFKERKLNSGIVLLNDNGTTAGIRPRWGRIYAVGPDQHEYSVGQWICVAHGRWTRGVEIEDADGQTVTIRKIDPKDVLLLSDEQPSDDTMSDAVQVTAQKR
jgi:co-chaperonin GroES (HSP10)